ncbi:MAG: gluconate 2-dehydrogenase subunit 3 family protein [Clostridia bacterium]|nr:gluconate 2-dehydrogenase subunit 3 family protein [Clostridia bacterium]
MQSFYPQFDMLQNSDHWDEYTARLIRKRMIEPGKPRFLAEQELELLKKVCSRLLGEENGDRLAQVVGHIDHKLADNIGEGYRKANLPEERILFRNGLTGINETAKGLFQGKEFPDLKPEEQDRVLTEMAGGQPPGAIWQGLPAKDFFKILLREAVEIYCSLPGVWSQMGYAGPAYPRGYVRIELGGVDPWEAVRDGE